MIRGARANRLDIWMNGLPVGYWEVSRGAERLAYCDDWVADEQGRPLYKTVRLAPGWAITNSSGDDPHNSVLSDGHAGVVWNTLWAQHLVTSLNAAFGLHLTPITDAEVIGFLEPSFAARHD